MHKIVQAGNGGWQRHSAESFASGYVERCIKQTLLTSTELIYRVNIYKSADVADRKVLLVLLKFDNMQSVCIPRPTIVDSEKHLSKIQ